MEKPHILQIAPHGGNFHEYRMRSNPTSKSRLALSTSTSKSQYYSTYFSWYTNRHQKKSARQLQIICTAPVLRSFRWSSCNHHSPRPHSLQLVRGPLPQWRPSWLFPERFLWVFLYHIKTGASQKSSSIKTLDLYIFIILYLIFLLSILLFKVYVCNPGFPTSTCCAPGSGGRPSSFAAKLAMVACRQEVSMGETQSLDDWIHGKLYEYYMAVRQNLMSSK
jgi:hypothetical protein